MNSEEYFNNEKEQIEAIDEKLVKVPYIPIGIYLQESQDLKLWCAKDIEELVDAGMDRTIVDAIDLRAGALRHTQSLWMNQHIDTKDVELDWKCQSAKAFEFRDELIHNFKS